MGNAAPTTPAGLTDFDATYLTKVFSLPFHNNR
jgi:hypothetical protein